MRFQSTRDFDKGDLWTAMVHFFTHNTSLVTAAAAAAAVVVNAGELATVAIEAVVITPNQMTDSQDEPIQRTLRVPSLSSPYIFVRHCTVLKSPALLFCPSLTCPVTSRPAFSAPLKSQLIRP